MAVRFIKRYNLSKQFLWYLYLQICFVINL